MSNITNKEGISVVICCYNSENVIEETLRHLSQQSMITNIPCEIIIVNNNCTDQTVKLATNFWKKTTCNIPLIVIKEEEAGLSFARKKGIVTANYEYIIFCDDDNWLDKDYLYNSYNIMSSQSQVAAVGGLGTPVFEGEKPEWFDLHAKSYAVGPQGKKEGKTNRILFGAGLVFRKSLVLFLHKNGFVSILTDRKGKELSSGNDSELTITLSNSSLDLWYSPNLKFKHFLTKERLTTSYLEKLNKGFGKSMPYIQLYFYHIKNTDTTFKSWINNLWLFHILILCITIIKIMLFFPRKQSSFLTIRYFQAIKELMKIFNNYSFFKKQVAKNLSII